MSYKRWSLKVFVTEATIPTMTVGMFKDFTEQMKQKIKNKQMLSDLSAYVIGDLNKDDFPTVITKINSATLVLFHLKHS